MTADAPRELDLLDFACWCTGHRTGYRQGRRDERSALLVRGGVVRDEPDERRRERKRKRQARKAARNGRR
jgi:hypothetical protein